MTPSNSIAVDIFTRPVRALSFILRAVWAFVVLLSVCLLWLVLFLLCLPFLIAGELLGLRKKFSAADARRVDRLISSTESIAADCAKLTGAAGKSTDQFIFDRRKDVSKLFGCNTRNVQYRWSLFARKLDDIKGRFPDPKAIDFGAGSLRDSYELSRLGFAVVAVDLNERLMRQYYDFYDWQQLPSGPQLFARSLDDLLSEKGPNSFDLAIAFDVIEHLEDPAAYVRNIRSLLKPDGLFFTIVPNRRSIFEKYFKYSIEKHKRQGIAWIPGVPHMQFKTPEEWQNFFEENGYAILEHEMAIGPLVNDLWHGLLGLPLTVFVDPVLQTAAYKFRFQYSGASLAAFYPAWLMERISVWDAVFKKWLKPDFGWNLIVAAKHDERKL